MHSTYLRGKGTRSGWVPQEGFWGLGFRVEPQTKIQKSYRLPTSVMFRSVVVTISRILFCWMISPFFGTIIIMIIVDVILVPLLAIQSQICPCRWSPATYLSSPQTWKLRIPKAGARKPFVLRAATLKLSSLLRLQARKS